MSITLNGNGTITGYTPTTISGTLAASSLPTGSIVQTKHLQFTTELNGTAASHTDITGFALSITPTSASNDILIILHFSGSLDCDGRMGFKRNGTQIEEYFLGTSRLEENDTGTFCGTYKDSPNSDQAVTYQVTVRVTGCNQTYSINKPQQGSGDNGKSGMTLMEVAA